MRIVFKDIRAFNKMIAAKGLTKRGFGRAVGIHESYAIQLCNGSRCPGPYAARKIVEFLGVDFDDVFYIDWSYSREKEKEVSNA